MANGAGCLEGGDLALAPDFLQSGWSGEVI